MKEKLFLYASGICTIIVVLKRVMKSRRVEVNTIKKKSATKHIISKKLVKIYSDIFKHHIQTKSLLNQR